MRSSRDVAHQLMFVCVCHAQYDAVDYMRTSHRNVASADSLRNDQIKKQNIKPQLDKFNYTKSKWVSRARFAFGGGLFLCVCVRISCVSVDSLSLYNQPGDFPWKLARRELIVCPGCFFGSKVALESFCVCEDLRVDILISLYIYIIVSLLARVKINYIILYLSNK